MKKLTLRRKKKKFSSSDSISNSKETIASMIRVDHAGEFGAIRIYDGQLAVLKKGEAAKNIREMLSHEKKHLAYFKQLLNDYKVRPTILHPLWDFAGYFLGYATAKMGEKTAMLCTAAVEEVIDEHYSDQLKTFNKLGKKGLAKKIQKLTNAEIMKYINKLKLIKIQTSGLYQIEGTGIILFEKIKGSYFTILGLPLLPLLGFLKKKGF